MRRSTVDAMVRAANPVTEEDVSAWLRSPAAFEARAFARALVDGPALVPASRRRRRVPTVVLAAALILALGAVAGAASVMLGEPAPPAV